MIDAKAVAALRETSGAGMMDAKRALEKTNGDVEKALDVLRKKGIAKAAKKASERTAAEGWIGSYVHSNGKVGVLVEVNCETDFVARNDAFQELVHDLALHVAATDPLYVRREDVPTDVAEKEKELARAELAEQKKPVEMIEKIVCGKIEKYYSEVCLLEQQFVKDDKVKVADLIAAASVKLGEKIDIHKFVRFSIVSAPKIC